MRPASANAGFSTCTPQKNTPGVILAGGYHHIRMTGRHAPRETETAHRTHAGSDSEDLRRISKVARRAGSEPTQKRNRPDHDGSHRLAFERAKKTILATCSICGICGKPVDKSLKYPHPMSPSIDHIIPIDRGGHPSDPDNLQLAHWICNRQKSNKLNGQQPGRQGTAGGTQSAGNTISNRDLPLSMDWSEYRSS